MIGAKVANALALYYPRERLEVIVASDGSGDATAERAREAGADLVLELPRGGKTAAQNAAAERAGGELLAFSDANSEWEPGRASPPRRALRRPGGRLRLRPGAVPLARGRQPRGRLLALRDGGPRDGVEARRDHRRQRRDLRGPPRRLRRPAPSGSHDLSFPFLLAKRGLRSRYVPAAAAGGEDGADDRGRVRPQTADDGRPLGHRRRRRDARRRAATRRCTGSSSSPTGCSAT